MVPRKLSIMTLWLCLSACDGCGDGGSGRAEPVSTRGVAAGGSAGAPDAVMVEGGEDSAEALVQAWYGLVSDGDLDGLALITLSAEQHELIFDCSEVEEGEQAAERVDDLRERLEAEVGQRAAELSETGAQVVLERARANQSVEHEADSEVDGCVLQRPITKHKIRSTAKLTGEAHGSITEHRLMAAIEVDGGWFLWGVPGPLVPSVGTPRRAVPNRSQPIGPILKGSTPARVQQQRVQKPRTP